VIQVCDLWVTAIHELDWGKSGQSTQEYLDFRNNTWTTCLSTCLKLFLNFNLRLLGLTSPHWFAPHHTVVVCHNGSASIWWLISISWSTLIPQPLTCRASQGLHLQQTCSWWMANGFQFTIPILLPSCSWMGLQLCGSCIKKENRHHHSAQVTPHPPRQTHLWMSLPSWASQSYRATTCTGLSRKSRPRWNDLVGPVDRYTIRWCPWDVWSMTGLWLIITWQDHMMTTSHNGQA